MVHLIGGGFGTNPIHSSGLGAVNKADPAFNPDGAKVNAETLRDTANFGMNFGAIPQESHSGISSRAFASLVEFGNVHKVLDQVTTKEFSLKESDAELVIAMTAEKFLPRFDV